MKTKIQYLTNVAKGSHSKDLTFEQRVANSIIFSYQTKYELSDLDAYHSAKIFKELASMLIYGDEKKIYFKNGENYVSEFISTKLFAEAESFFKSLIENAVAKRAKLMSMSNIDTKNDILSDIVLLDSASIGRTTSVHDEAMAFVRGQHYTKLASFMAALHVVATTLAPSNKVLDWLPSNAMDRNNITHSRKLFAKLFAKLGYTDTTGSKDYCIGHYFFTCNAIKWTGKAAYKKNFTTVDEDLPEIDPPKVDPIATIDPIDTPMTKDDKNISDHIDTKTQHIGPKTQQALDELEAEFSSLFTEEELHPTHTERSLSPEDDEDTKLIEKLKYDQLQGKLKAPSKVEDYDTSDLDAMLSDCPQKQHKEKMNDGSRFRV